MNHNKALGVVIRFLHDDMIHCFTKKGFNFPRVITGVDTSRNQILLTQVIKHLSIKATEVGHHLSKVIFLYYK